MITTRDGPGASSLGHPLGPDQAVLSTFFYGHQGPSREPQDLILLVLAVEPIRLLIVSLDPARENPKTRLSAPRFTRKAFSAFTGFVSHSGLCVLLLPLVMSLLFPLPLILSTFFRTHPLALTSSSDRTWSGSQVIVPASTCSSRWSSASRFEVAEVFHPSIASRLTSLGIELQAR